MLKENEDFPQLVRTSIKLFSRKRKYETIP
jgi:hypothetical protein